MIGAGRNFYELLHEWKSPPGTRDDKAVDEAAFEDWLDVVRKSCLESGHLRPAFSQIGHVLVYAPSDPIGLWIHTCYARALDAIDAEAMRRGFRTELYNSRGVHGWSAGREEKEIAAKYDNQALQLEASGFVRLATELRNLADAYTRESEREANRDPYED